MKSSLYVVFMSLVVFSCNPFEGKESAMKTAIANDVEIYRSRDYGGADNEQVIVAIEEDNKLRNQNVDRLIKYAGDPDVDSLISFFREEVTFQSARSKVKARFVDLNQIRCAKIMGHANNYCSEYRRAERLANEQVRSALDIQNRLVRKQKNLARLGVPELYSIEGESDGPENEKQDQKTSIKVAPEAVSRDSMIDLRDQIVYPIVKIGNQVWMAKNMAFVPKGYASGCQQNQCNVYGRLYAWSAAMNACPDGWHLPAKNEWEMLMDNLGGQSDARIKLRSVSGWDNKANGQDEYGFSALPGGFFDGGGRFYVAGSHAYFWSSTQESAVGAWFEDLSDQSATGIGNQGKSKGNGFSVRCVKDET